MKILLFEDKYLLSHYDDEILKRENHIVFNCNTLYQAIEKWQDEKIDCIITDLNICCKGLTPEQEVRTRGSLLTGWVWLSDYILADDPKMTDKIIIYSDYIQDLTKYVSKEELNGIILISKSDPSGGNSKLYERVKKIASLIKQEE